MAKRKFSVQPHVKQLKGHANDKHKQIIRLLHRVRNHPKSYTHGKAPKTSKNSSRMPPKPKRLTKKASGLWDFLKKAHRWVSSKFSAGKKQLVAHGKKAMAVVAADLRKEGRAALSEGKKYVRGRYEHHKERFRKSARSHVQRFAQSMDTRIQGAHSRVNTALGDSDGMPGKSLQRS